MEIPEIETEGEADELRERARDELDTFEECKEMADKAMDEGKFTARMVFMDVAGEK